MRMTEMQVVLVAALGILATSCSKGTSEAPKAPAAETAPATETAPPAAETAPPAAETAPPATEAAAPAAETAPPAANAELSPDELREMERRPGMTPPPAFAQSKPAYTAKELAGAPGPTPVVGPDDAYVKVYVFSDFQCPVCRRVAEPLKQLARDFGDDVQIVWMNHALPSHPRAGAAARAAIAAQRQGKFWEYHDLLFDKQQLGDADLTAYAETLGLDLAKFAADMADPAVAAQVEYEGALAEAMGIRGTPGFVVNGQKTVGWGSYLGVKSQVQRALDVAKALETAGTPKARVAIEATVTAGEDGATFAQLVYGEKKR